MYQSVTVTHFEHIQTTSHRLWQPSLRIVQDMGNNTSCPMPQANSKTDLSTSISDSPIDDPFCFAQELFQISHQIPKHPNETFPPPFLEMAPQTTATANQEPSSAADTESVTWCIPFLAFYAFGILASMTMLWAAAKFSNTPPWPPACLRNDNRFGPLYQVVLYFPAFLWLVVLAVGILCLLGCSLLHIWRWLVRKLTSAFGRTGTCDEVSLSRQTDGVGRVPLTPVGGLSTDTTKDAIVQVEQETGKISMAEEGIRTSTPGSQEHSVRMQQLSTADKNTRQEPGEVKEQSQMSNSLESRDE